MRPAFGRLKVSTRLISVLLPAPEEPTRAVVEPAAARNEMRFRTSAPGTYSKLTFSKAMSPATSASGARAPSSASSVTSRRISRIRSSPANASVICVPIEAMLMSGRATRPMKTPYMKKSPSVIWFDRIACPPSRIIRMPIAPMMMVAKAPTAEIPVMVVAMLRNSVLAPRVNTSRSLRSARQAETGDGLHEGGAAGRERERQQQLGVVLVDHPVDHPLGGRGQDQAGEAVDEHQRESHRQAAAVRVDEGPRLLPGTGRDGLLGGSGRGVGHESQRNLSRAGPRGST